MRWKGRFSNPKNTKFDQHVEQQRPQLLLLKKEYQSPDFFTKTTQIMSSQPLKMQTPSAFHPMTNSTNPATMSQVSFEAMSSAISFQFQYLDLADPSQRVVVQQALSGGRETAFHQSDGSHLPNNLLLEALNAFANEDEASDLTLEQLEELSGGVGLPEAMVSSTILMAMVAGASGMFAGSMGAVNNSEIQDALNAGIHANIESIRHDLTEHRFDDDTGTYVMNKMNQSGAYVSVLTPGTQLGQDFITEQTQQANLIDDDNNAQNGIQTSMSIGGETVERTIVANGNSITVTYSYGSVDIQSTDMLAPAAAWL